MTPRIFFVLLACLELAACGAGPGTGLPTGGSGGGDSFVLDFSAQPASSGGAPEVEAQGRSGEIFARGSIDTSLPCAQVRGSAARDDRQIDLRVTASPDEACSTDADTFAYEAFIRELDAGTYRFSLMHVLPERTDTVLDREVDVR